MDHMMTNTSAPVIFREFIQELRGDFRWEAIDIYDHIDIKELKEA